MNKEYKMPPLGLFGKRCRIKNVHNMNDGFVYRIVNSGIRSNCWKEPPLGRWGNEPIQHDEMEEIVIVVCDTLIDDNSKLERVALKDVEIMEEQEPMLDKIKAEIERQEKWLLQAGYNAYNVDIAFDAIKHLLAESEDKE